MIQDLLKTKNELSQKSWQLKTNFFTTPPPTSLLRSQEWRSRPKPPSLKAGRRSAWWKPLGFLSQSRCSRASRQPFIPVSLPGKGCPSPHLLKPRRVRTFPALPNKSLLIQPTFQYKQSSKKQQGKNRGSPGGRVSLPFCAAVPCSRASCTTWVPYLCFVNWTACEAIYWEIWSTYISLESRSPRGRVSLPFPSPNGGFKKNAFVYHFNMKDHFNVRRSRAPPSLDVPLDVLTPKHQLSPKS